MVHISGGCQCGAVRYETDAEPIFAGHCQCNDCKRSSGSAHVSGAAFPEVAVKITGKLKGYSSTADSGGTATREFCQECGSRVSFRSTNMPGMIILTAGTMDNPGAINPGMAVYQKRHVAWDHFDPALPTFETVPPRS